MIASSGSARKLTEVYTCLRASVEHKKVFLCRFPLEPWFPGLDERFLSILRFSRIGQNLFSDGVHGSQVSANRWREPGALGERALVSSFATRRLQP